MRPFSSIAGLFLFTDLMLEIVRAAPLLEQLHTCEGDSLIYASDEFCRRGGRKELADAIATHNHLQVISMAYSACSRVCSLGISVCARRDSALSLAAEVPKRNPELFQDIARMLAAPKLHTFVIGGLGIDIERHWRAPENEVFFEAVRTRRLARIVFRPGRGLSAFPSCGFFDLVDACKDGGTSLCVEMPSGGGNSAAVINYPFEVDGYVTSKEIPDGYLVAGRRQTGAIMASLEFQVGQKVVWPSYFAGHRRHLLGHALCNKRESKRYEDALYYPRAPWHEIDPNAPSVSVVGGQRHVALGVPPVWHE